MNKKDSGVAFLLFTGICFNAIIFPLGVLYSYIFNVDYITIDECTYSIIINLLAWQALYYSFKNTLTYPTPKSLSVELKKFSLINVIDEWLKVKLNTPEKRKQFFKIAFQAFVVINFILPLLLKWIFSIKIHYNSWAFAFVFAQLFTIVYYRLQKQFPEDIEEKDTPMPNPWILHLLYLMIFKKKSF
ncbi:hypothetical protein [Sediminibacterium sp.]|uniref:hypothetical protein n=1 Tax=Sediminibacterium sp. TaxID=1917865 RepID=UPI003F716D01